MSRSVSCLFPVLYLTLVNFRFADVSAVNLLREKAILTRRARGRPRLNRGGPANHSIRYTGRLKSTFNKISPAKQVIPVDPYSDLQIVPSDVS